MKYPAICRLLVFANNFFNLFYGGVCKYKQSPIFVLPNEMKRAGKQKSHGKL